MKSIRYYIPAFGFFLLGCVLNGQVVTDPLKKVYKIGGSSEIFISYINSDATNSNQGILDVSMALDDLIKVEEAKQTKYTDQRKTASAAGDFNGDGSDEVVNILNHDDLGIVISIPLVGEDLVISGMNVLEDSMLNNQEYTRIRVIAGNFDNDPQDEFAICYDLPDQTLVLELFKMDPDLTIKKKTSLRGILYYDRNFDIAAGDLDGDGIDEIGMVRNRALPTRKAGSSPPVFISKYDLSILKYNPVTGLLDIKQEQENITLENPVPLHNYYSNVSSIINEMRIACGDLNNNGRDEVVVGWSYYYSYAREYYCPGGYVFGVCVGGEKLRYYYWNTTFLNTFRVTGTGTIENYQNIFVDEDYFGFRGVSADQHIGMTLKCVQMDNQGRSEVLVNTVSGIRIFGKSDDDMGLRKITQVMPWSGYLNIQGNETFTVADLNPDTSTQNFNKEVILLQSDKTAAEQLSTGPSGITKLLILSIDTISEETMAFHDPGPALDIPFGNSDNIEISGFLAGDFDINDADIYIVGNPVIIPVSNLQQPIVILNSPPVHFDVIEGEVLDICNTYTGDTPDFYARYNTTINEQKTTSVMVDNGYGFSSDIRGYAMSGGTGFEAALKTTWEKGRSFYNASIQNKTIEEAKSIDTEDYVLFSDLDYGYHKYPVFDRKRNKIGEVAVLNPVSTNFSSSWESANSWNHPSYVFNHEPGNILSYKQKIKSLDFSSRPSDFLFHEFTGVTVAPSGDQSFSFSFDNISSSGTSYSYSGGIGADLFTKIGVETTVSLSLSLPVIEGSLASDVRIGVSSDLSSWYHNSTLSTHSTELRNTFQIEGNIGRLETRFDEMFRYKITPYIYRSQSGAMVLDYMVELVGNMYWWEKYYGEKPDLAFILPWRYATEKGIDKVRISRKQKTSDIQFYQPIVNPGDTVIIVTRVHNFSLKTFNGLLEVEYYLGDPADGGVQLTDIFGAARSSNNSTMKYGTLESAEYDREEYLTFIWKVPDTVSCSPRIYAVIDPDNAYEEIHTNNNIGWNLLNIYDCQECKYVERITQTDNIFSRQQYFKAYPNPFSSSCQIRFSLPQPEDVQIELYNLAGHKITTVINESFDSGEHELNLDAGNLDEGIYLCKISSGSNTEIIKLILIR